MEDLERLLERTLAGESEAFGRVAERFREMAFGSALVLLRNAADAEDAAQEAFRVAYDRLGDLRDPARFPGWLQRIVRSTCRDVLRRRQAGSISLCYVDVPSPAEDDPEQRAEAAELGRAVRAAVGSLSEPNRAATTLFYLDGYSVHEVAGLLAVPEGTVKRRLHDSRKQLAEKLRPYAPGLDVAAPALLPQRRSEMAANKQKGTDDTGVPAGWFLAGSHPREYEARVDRDVVHGGRASARVSFTAETASGFGTLMQTIRSDEYRGERVRLSAHIKAEAVSGWAGLWMRVDGPSTRSGSAGLAFDNMQDRPIRGTLDWQRYEVVLDVDEEAVDVAFGVLLHGKGTIWIDDCSFETVGKDVPTTGGGMLSLRPRNLGFEE